VPTRRLHIGAGLDLTLDAVTATLLVYGSKGMGKTNLLSVVLEEMSKAALRWCSIDPIGVHWGLRHAADGRGDGVPCLILGGTHGDMPITPGSGEIVADLVADEHVNVIVDCSRDHLGKMWTHGERTRFITAFIRRLYMRQGSLVDGQRRDPIFVALDEAARYIPQQIPHGNPDLAASVAAWEQLVEEGRNVGIGVGLFTQRSARLNKSVAELADMMLAFRTVGPNSIDAIIDWLGEHVPKADQRAMIEQVRKLAVGTALLVSPGWLEREGVVQIRARETFDSSVTPKPGERARRVVGTGATVDLDVYRTRMAEVVEEANASNPKVLRAEVRRIEVERARLADEVGAAGIRETALREQKAALQAEIDALQAELAARPAEPVGLSEDAVAVVQRLDAAFAEVEQRIAVEREFVTKALVPSGEVHHRASKGAERATRVAQPATGVAHRVPQEAPRRATPAPVPQVQRATHSAPSPDTEPDPSLSGAPRRILTVMVEAGIPLTDRVIAARSGVSRKRSTFRNAMSTLRGKGYIEGSTTSPTVTQNGVDALGDTYEPLPTGRALVDHWMGLLSETPKRMLTAILDHWPEWVDHDEVARLADVDRSKSTYRNGMSALRGYDLVTTTTTKVVANDEIGRAWNQ
jgi:hypothetical protein